MGPSLHREGLRRSYTGDRVPPARLRGLSPASGGSSVSTVARIAQPAAALLRPSCGLWLGVLDCGRPERPRAMKKRHEPCRALWREVGSVH